MEQIVYMSFFIVCVTAITLLIFNHYNKYKRLERYLYENKKEYYVISQICYYIIFISMVFNARYLVYQLIAFLLFKYYKIKMNFT